MWHCAARPFCSLARDALSLSLALTLELLTTAPISPFCCCTHMHTRAHIGKVIYIHINTLASNIEIVFFLFLFKIFYYFFVFWVGARGGGWVGFFFVHACARVAFTHPRIRGGRCTASLSHMCVHACWTSHCTPPLFAEFSSTILYIPPAAAAASFLVPMRGFFLFRWEYWFYTFYIFFYKNDKLTIYSYIYNWCVICLVVYILSCDVCVYSDYTFWCNWLWIIWILRCVIDWSRYNCKWHL